MKILFVSVEVSPFAKVGGLADVAGSLPKALKALGHDVRIIMPAYKMVEHDPQWHFEDALSSLTVSLTPHDHKSAYVKQTELDGVPVYLLGTDEWFCDVDRSEAVYTPGSRQYLFFSAGLLETVHSLGWKPDIIHCNDWHTGFTPVVMREKNKGRWDETASVFTIHNLGYQGEFGIEILDQLGLPHSLYNMDQLETFGHVNFLKAGCVYSDQINTVSERYAQEIQTEGFGCNLHGLMKYLAEEGRLKGILNGIDKGFFDPSRDRHISDHFTVDSLEGKRECKLSMLKEVGLPHLEGVPVLGVVTRLSDQKGIDLVIKAAEQIAALPAQLVVLGTGSGQLAGQLDDLSHRFPQHIKFIEGFSVNLAPKIYAGSDMFLMPSAYEPCGLGQMIALRYGTIPIVRETGGLADTIHEGQNGFVHQARTVEDFMGAVRRAHSAYQQPEQWTELVKTAMRCDFGWDQSARKYVEMYEAALEYRRAANAECA